MLSNFFKDKKNIIIFALGILCVLLLVCTIVLGVSLSASNKNDIHIFGYMIHLSTSAEIALTYLYDQTETANLDDFYYTTSIDNYTDKKIVYYPCAVQQVPISEPGYVWVKPGYIDAKNILCMYVNIPYINDTLSITEYTVKLYYKDKLLAKKSFAAPSELLQIS